MLHEVPGIYTEHCSAEHELDPLQLLGEGMLERRADCWPSGIRLFVNHDACHPIQALLSVFPKEHVPQRMAASVTKKALAI
jgi:hypothetical protein